MTFKPGDIVNCLCGCGITHITIIKVYQEMEFAEVRDYGSMVIRVQSLHQLRLATPPQPRMKLVDKGGYYSLGEV
jgi:hypothetical protein